MANLDITIPTTTLPDGSEIPMIGYGTGTAWFKKTGFFTSADKKLIESIETAIKLGYNHLDGAESYGTESELGTAIKNSGVARDKLFVTTKVSTNIENIPDAITQSLKNLGLDYVDLYLVHEPFFADADPQKLQVAWAAMEEVQASGKAKSIGVSNFYRQHLDIILKTAKVRPAINQIEFHPYLQHEDLISYHKNNDIRVAAYGPQVPVTKAQGGPLDAKLAELARKYAVGPGEILLRWVLDQNIVAITTSSKEQRMSDYLRVATFKLTPKEHQDVTEIGAQHHFRGFFQARFDPADRS